MYYNGGFEIHLFYEFLWIHNLSPVIPPKTLKGLVKEMKEFKISYYLGEMFHCYTEVAENELKAIQKALDRIPDTSNGIFHDFQVKRK